MVRLRADPSASPSIPGAPQPRRCRRVPCLTVPHPTLTAPHARAHPAPPTATPGLSRRYPTQPELGPGAGGTVLPMDAGKTRGAAQPWGDDAASSHGGTSGRGVPGFGQRCGAGWTLTNRNKSNPSGLQPSAARGVAD